MHPEKVLCTCTKQKDQKTRRSMPIATAYPLETKNNVGEIVDEGYQEDGFDPVSYYATICKDTETSEEGGLEAAVEMVVATATDKDAVADDDEEEAVADDDEVEAAEEEDEEDEEEDEEEVAAADEEEEEAEMEDQEAEGGGGAAASPMQHLLAAAQAHLRDEWYKDDFRSRAAAEAVLNLGDAVPVHLSGTDLPSVLCTDRLCLRSERLCLPLRQVCGARERHQQPARQPTR